LLHDVSAAAKALAKGYPVMIYDSSDREGEVDLVFYAGSIDAEKVYILRTRAGGLICYAAPLRVITELGIPYGDDILRSMGLSELASKRLKYGDRSAFTIWVNHIDVETGIRDADRAKTITELHKVTELVLSGRGVEAREKFLKEFQAPGHVPILASRSLIERRGHTELAIHLALIAGLPPSVAFAEMLKRGTALTLEEAKVISESLGWPLVDGESIVRACENEEMCRSS